MCDVECWGLGEVCGGSVGYGYVCDGRGEGGECSVTRVEGWTSKGRVESVGGCR